MSMSAPCTHANPITSDWEEHKLHDPFGLGSPADIEEERKFREEAYASAIAELALARKRTQEAYGDRVPVAGLYVVEVAERKLEQTKESLASFERAYETT